MTAERERIAALIESHIAEMGRDKGGHDQEPASLRAYAYAAHALRAVLDLVRSGRSTWIEGYAEAIHNEQDRLDAMIARMKAEQEAERWDD